MGLPSIILQRWARAWRYATAATTDVDAEAMLFEMGMRRGWYPLETLCVDDVKQQALQKYQPGSELDRLVEQATAFVGEKWNCKAGLLGAAVDWALDKIEEWAAEDGIVLLPVIAPPQLMWQEPPIWVLADYDTRNGTLHEIQRRDEHALADSISDDQALAVARAEAAQSCVEAQDAVRQHDRDAAGVAAWRATAR